MLLLALLLDVLPAGLLLEELAAGELLLHATAPISVAAARTAGEPRRNARPAPLPCFVEIISCLAGKTGGLTARGELRPDLFSPVGQIGSLFN